MICKNRKCQREFVPTNGKQRYCCNKCTQAEASYNRRSREKKLRRAAHPEKKQYLREAGLPIPEKEKDVEEPVEVVVEPEPPEPRRGVEHRPGVCRVCGRKARAKHLTYCELCYKAAFDRYRPASRGAIA